MGLPYLAAELSARADLLRWATAPAAALPAEWAVSTVTFLTRSRSCEIMAQRPIALPVPVLGVSLRGILAERAPALQP